MTRLDKTEFKIIANCFCPLYPHKRNKLNIVIRRKAADAIIVRTFSNICFLLPYAFPITNCQTNKLHSRNSRAMIPFLESHK